MISIRDLSFSYGSKSVFSGLSLTVKKGETVAVMGPSGCGKSTLLQLIAGLQSSGIRAGTLSVSAQKIGYAFQEPRLFPWLTVEENLALVLPKEREPERLSELLSAMRLNGVARLYPHQLSGGMACRVSLARALLYEAELILLDEPFSALDKETKQAILVWLKDHLQKGGKTLVLVTHLQDEASALCDRILQFDQLTKKE